MDFKIRDFVRILPRGGCEGHPRKPHSAADDGLYGIVSYVKGSDHPITVHYHKANGDLASTTMKDNCGYYDADELEHAEPVGHEVSA